ncbi:S phase cyclin A-associated protein in the endoplasmic reticulum isoform X5 [Mobula birostris]|uniref:S phase cyclin A-associated protein in the endoplasmic reticulum isoform X5 n=1 Tax=Mobula birostris TaxID=1983395 RepID=UPI003B28C9AF
MSKESRSEGRRRREHLAPGLKAAFLGGGDGRERSGQYKSGAGAEPRDRPGPKMGPGGDERERSGSGSSGSSYGGKSKSLAGCGSSKASFQRSNSHDKVRKIVAQEGRAARNLIAWSVPLENKDDDGKSKTHNSGKTRETVKSQRSVPSSQRILKQSVSTEKSSLSSVGEKNAVEKSPTKGRQLRKIDLRARYWAFLFDNLRRAVDEIYVTCESDQSVVECKEVLMMLDNYVRDFKALIDWLQLQEKLEKTDAQNRPTSLAWEVRKMSPGRHVMPSPPADRICTTSNARRSLNFGAPNTMAAPTALVAARLAPTGVSWADKVKANGAGTTISAASKHIQKSSPRIRLHPNDSKDTEGWETVQRGRTTRSRSATMAANAGTKVSGTMYLSLKDDSDKENGVSVSQNGDLEFEQTSPSSDSVTVTPEKLNNQNEDSSMDSFKHTANMPTDSVQPDNMQDKSWQQETDSGEREKDVVCLSQDMKVEVTPTVSVQEPSPSESPRLGPDMDLSSELSNVNEIAFINTLEAQNKRHDVLAKLKEYEQRLNELQEERHRRQEEKQARDEAVQERKRALEAERQARVEELLLKRREQEARIEQQRQEKERAREDAARERAREREERLAALSAAQQEAMEELQKKIQLKHDESSRRHMEQIEQRKEKAAELSSGRHANTDYAPKLIPYERKKHCSLCNVLITSEVYLFSHIKGRKHQQAVRENSSIQGRELSDEEVEHLSCKKYITDVVTETYVHPEVSKDAEEKQKIRKKAKKLRARMNSRGKEYESSLETKAQIPDSPFKAKLQRLVKDLLKQQQGQDSGPWANNKVLSLDRTLGEINRILEKQNSADQIGFQVGGGLTALEQILQVVNAISSPNVVPRIPVKSLCNVVNAYCFACSGCYDNCFYVLFSNKITFLIELLMHQLTLFVPGEDEAIFGKSVNKQVFEGLTTGLLQTCATVLGCLASHQPEINSHPGTPKKSGQDAKNNLSQSELYHSRIQDLISYVVHTGLADKLYGCFLSIQGPVDEQPKIASFLQNVTALLHSMCRLCFNIVNRSHNIFENKRHDPTGLSAVLQSTELVGVLNMLYCILLHGTVPDHNTSPPVETYPQHIIQVAIQSLRFLNSFAFLDLPTFQAVCGAEGLSLAFRHIVSSLLWYCYHHTSEDLLHEVIVCVGYFTVNHPDNQVTVQSGRHPTVLQKLCQLPFQYFSDQRLIKVLFPTLITACYNNPQNKVILEQEMSCVLLATFIQDFAQSLSQTDKPSHQAAGAACSQDYLEFSNRFPREMWEDARKFFLQKEPVC